MTDLSSLPNDVTPTERRPRANPTGTDPQATWNGTEGEIVTGNLPAEPDPHEWDHIIEDWGLNPERVMVQPGSVEIRAWDANAGRDPETGEVRIERLRYYKAKLIERTISTDRLVVDYDGLVDEIRSWKPSARSAPTGDYLLLVNLADWQIGSADGRGTQAIIARVLGMVDEVSQRITALRKMGYKIGRIHVQGLGDLFEGCTGHYAMQEFSVELDRRQQTRVIRRLLKTALTTWVNRVDLVTVGTVPGNHGENRKDGKAFTSFGDNDDVAVFEAIAEMFQENPELRERVLFSIPDDEMVQVFDLNGTDVAFTHAHIATRNKAGGKLPPAQGKVLTWWEQQVFGDVFEGIAEAQLLVTGHYHHFSVIEHGKRTHMQCPAMDDGSIWFTNTSGQLSRAGTLTMLLKDGEYEALEIVGSRVPAAAA